MLKLSNPEYKDVFENLYNPELFKLNEELSAVDRLLNDERLLEPYREKFNTKRGRPTIPIATYLRMMYLKFRYQFGYETLVKEVSDSLKWRRFCQIPLDGRVPDSTTLIKLTHKYSKETVEKINTLMVHKLKEQKVIRGKKMRMDTTVVESDIHYPTDIGLLADAIRKITKTVQKIKDEGVATKTKFRNRCRSVKRTILKLGKGLRKKGQAKKEAVKERTASVLKIVRQVLSDAKKFGDNAARNLRNKKDHQQAKRLLEKLRGFTHITDQLKEQTEKVLSNSYSITNRIVSVFDPEARPIKKGKLSTPVEFGHKVIFQETEHGIITGYRVLSENPFDSTLVEEALKRHKDIFNRSPDELATDRGFSSPDNEELAQKAGVKRISMPKRGNPSRQRKQYQKQYWFKRLQRFRVGAEAKISLLKRKFGLKRSRLRGTIGTQIYVGWGILAHNLWQTARLR
jgi:IS5 family transposase